MPKLLKLTNMKNSKKPAYPVNENDLTELLGLTKREYFAAMAMTAFIVPSYSDTNDINFIAKRSVEMADALLTELE